MVVRLNREASLEGSYVHRASKIGGYRNGYKSEGLPNASGSLNFLVSKMSGSVDTPLYLDTMNRGHRSSEALLNVAAECYIKGVNSCEISKIFKPFDIESMSSTPVSNINQKLDEGFETSRNRNLVEFPYLILDAV